MLYRMVTGELEFVGKNFEELTEYMMSRYFFISGFLSLPMPKFFTKINNPRPQPKTNHGRDNERLLGQHWPARRTEAKF